MVSVIFSIPCLDQNSVKAYLEHSLIDYCGVAEYEILSCGNGPEEDVAECVYAINFPPKEVSAFSIISKLYEPAFDGYITEEMKDWFDGIDIKCISLKEAPWELMPTIQGWIESFENQATFDRDLNSVVEQVHDITEAVNDQTETISNLQMVIKSQGETIQGLKTLIKKICANHGIDMSEFDFVSTEQIQKK